jgi:hypothetical protein
MASLRARHTRSIRFSSGQCGGHDAQVCRENAPLGRVRPAIVERYDVQAAGEGLGERIDEELEALGIERRGLQEEPLPGCRGPHALAILPPEDVLHRADRLRTAGGEVLGMHGQQAEVAFGLTEHPYWLGVNGGMLPLQPLATIRLKLLDSVRLFLCDWVVAS